MNHIRVMFRARHNILLSKRNELGFTQAEMAGYLGITLEQYARAERLEPLSFRIAERIAMQFDTTIEQLFPPQMTLYGEMINGGQKYIELNDNIVLERGERIQEKLLTESFHIDFESLCKELTPQESEVLHRYFGIDCIKMDLGKIGEEMNLSRERIRQIREKALRRLKHGTRGELLRQYLGYPSGSLGVE